jgi:predicted nuclease of predicted toxin-antitoxin system
MKLLFDQNLSPKLVGIFAKQFVGSKYLQELNLDEVDDLAEICSFVTNGKL